MIKLSNYCKQAEELPAQNEYQIAILKIADSSTFLREATKIGTVIGIVGLSASKVFNFNPAVAVSFTIVCGVSWLLFRTCAQRIEPKAQNMIQHFQELKDGKAF